MTDSTDYHQRLIETWSVLDDQGRVERIGEFFAPSWVLHTSEGEYTRDQFAEFLAGVQQAFPDLVSRIEDVVGEERRVAYRWTSEGTHLGEFMGIPPTSRRIKAMGIAISHFDDEGRMVEDWASWNGFSILHSLGITPIR